MAMVLRAILPAEAVSLGLNQVDQPQFQEDPLKIEIGNVIGTDRPQIMEVAVVAMDGIGETGSVNETEGIEIGIESAREIGFYATETGNVSESVNVRTNGTVTVSESEWTAIEG